jgi:HlyD family secretion protein
VTGYVWKGYVGTSALVGEAESVRAQVGSTTSGRILRLQVDALQRVAAGQTIALVLPVEPKVLDAQIAISKARMDLIRSGISSDVRKENMRINLEKLRLDMMSKRVELVEARAKQTYAELELARVERLFAGTAGSTGGPVRSIYSQADLDVARRDVNASTAMVVELNRLVSEIDSAIREMSVSEPKVDGDLPSSVRAAINVEESNLDLLEAQMLPQELVAPFDGIVSVVHRQAGETILAGEAILTVSKEKPSRVVAFVRQPLNLDPKVGMKIEVRCRGGRRLSGVGEVLSVGSQLEPVYPTLLPRNANAAGNGSGNVSAELGLPVFVSLPNDLVVRPGELVELHGLIR